MIRMYLEMFRFYIGKLRNILKSYSRKLVTVFRYVIREHDICPHRFVYLDEIKVSTMEYMSPCHHTGIHNNWWSVGNTVCIHYQCKWCGTVMDAIQDSMCAEGFGRIPSDRRFRSKYTVVE
jgi:hypothetical protein